MNYEAFLENRGRHFRRVAARRGDAIVCTTTFGAVDLTSHVRGLALGRLEQQLVEDVGGYAVMHGRCDITPLVEFSWSNDHRQEHRITVQYVKNAAGSTFICVQRGSHCWHAVARTNSPENPLLMKDFFSTRRAHDGEGFGFCASRGVPRRIYNYRPDLFDVQTIIDMYGYWLRWAERMIGYKALHRGVWREEPKHGIGTKRADIGSFSNAIRGRIWNRPLTTLVVQNCVGVEPSAAPQPTPVEIEPPRGISLPERLCWYRDGYEKIARILLDELQDKSNLPAARDLAEKIIVVVGDKPEPLAEYLVILGVIQARMGEYEKAESAYRRSIALEPTEKKIWYFAHNNLGYCLNQLGQHREAERYLRQAVEIEPRWHNAYKNLGVALSGQGNHAEAAKLYVLATTLTPSDPRALDLLEELLEQHELVFVQVPEIRADLEKCRGLVKRRDIAPDEIRRISPTRPAEASTSGTEAAPGHPKTVAVLDDESLQRELLGEVLTSEGLEVLACWDKRLFLKELPKLSVDLVITDICSPVMNGIRFLGEMKRRDKWKGIPVIFVTGLGSSEYINLKLQGAFEVIQKPYRIEDLMAAVKKALPGWRGVTD